MTKILQSFFGRLLLNRNYPATAFFSFKPFYLNWRKTENQVIPVKSMEKSLINYDQVLALSNHNMELAKKLLVAFLNELAPVPELFRPDPSAEEMDAISKLTHRIKPSLQLLQLESLNQTMNLYKMRYREGSSSARAELPALYSEIMRLYQIVVEEIRSYISNLQD